MVTALVCNDHSLDAIAAALCEHYGLAIKQQWPDDGEYHLSLTLQGLSLQQQAADKSAVTVDFCAGANAHRRRFGGGKGQDIAKAIGIGRYVPSVADLTAGLGRDAFVLASLGCQVTALERHPVVAALLSDGLSRAGNRHLPAPWQALQALRPVLVDDETRNVVQRIQLQHIGAKDWLQQQPDNSVDVIYLDPMFAHDGRQKAQVKKDMQAFRHVVGQDDDADELLHEALRVARCRCAVKRARKAPPLAGQAPTYALTGKANRFDVYAKAKVEAP
ncbi:rRNA methyltransferase [Bacterioplanes sanyensis]|uniref:Ribosomal RNA small subunit methyltransferase J n=1 Tax=Bacterioplanes sanyensis TaxID=1249553 RepID=A0A222FPH6_9GAMM|nr:rRNA methyltransferase [Bacterioplanes sanyensis]